MHHKMKFSPVILVFTLVIVLDTASTGEINNQHFVSCKPNEWIVTNTTITWDQNTKHLSSNITKSEPGGIIYGLHITISGCANNNCSGTPQVKVEKIDCNDMTNRNSNDVCRAAEEAAKTEKQEQWLTSRYGPLMGEDLFNLVSCINIEDTEYNDSLSSSSNESNDITKSSEQENK